MFLANENFPNPSIILLRQAGYKVQSIQEDFPGLPDEDVIQMSVREDLIILTFDSDYGELIFKYAMSNPPSVIYFREKGASPDFAANLLIDLMKENQFKLNKAFTVIEERNIRQRFYK